MSAGVRWREQLAAWAIPEHIRAAADESPWQPPVAAMARRMDERLAAPATPSLARTIEALDPAGTVLDVGAGAGAASLPVAARMTGLIAVDESPAMLAVLTERAASLGVPTTTVIGRWPDIAAQVSTVDVVVCHHVCYNVPDLAEFVLALKAHARRRVVIELSERHPMHVLNPYWKRLHGIDRPEGPTADDALAVFREAGLTPLAERWARPHTSWPHPPCPQTPCPRTPAGGFDEQVQMTRRALCLPAGRTAELAALMRAEPVPQTREVVTVLL
jgi:SAM-dependent methyltransferase